MPSHFAGMFARCLHVVRNSTQDCLASALDRDWKVKLSRESTWDLFALLLRVQEKLTLEPLVPNGPVYKYSTQSPIFFVTSLLLAGKPAFNFCGAGVTEKLAWHVV